MGDTVQILFSSCCNNKPCAMSHFLSLCVWVWKSYQLPCKYIWTVFIFYLWTQMLLVCLYLVYFVKTNEKKKQKKKRMRKFFFLPSCSCFLHSVAKVYCTPSVSRMIKIFWRAVSYNGFAVLMLYLRWSINKVHVLGSRGSSHNYISFADKYYLVWLNLKEHTCAFLDRYV